MTGINTSYYQSVSSLYSSFGSGSGSYIPSIPSLIPGVGTFGQNMASTSSSVKAYLTDVKRFSERLGAAAEKIVAGQPPVFSQMIAVLNRSEGDPASSSKVKSTAVQVDKVAETQVNTGNSLSADAKASRAGMQSFSIQAGGKNTTVSVNISETDNNRAAQQKIADAINRSGADVTASVQYDAQTKQSALVLEGGSTGDNGAFSLTDKYGGGIVSDYGLGFVSRQAQNAEFSVDGKSMVSSENKVELGGGIKVELTGTGTTNIDLYRDTGAIREAVTDLINGYNSLLQTAEAYGSDRLESRLRGAYDAFSASLSKSGIYMGFDGTLSIDENLLSKAIDDGSLETVLNLNNGKSGFAARLADIAKEAGQNPAGFASQTSGSSSFGTVNSLYDAAFGSSFKQYAFEMKYSSIGQLFDFML